MLTTGYKLREAIKQWELQRDAASRAFNSSLKYFEGESKEQPGSVVEAFEAAEKNIAMLQVAQMYYNLNVSTEFEGRQITLGEAIKLVGGVARIEKMWRTAAGEKKTDRYSYDDSNVREKDKTYALDAVQPADAVRYAAAVAKRASSLRAIIATLNAKEIDVPLLQIAI